MRFILQTWVFSSFVHRPVQEKFAVRERNRITHRNISHRENMIKTHKSQHRLLHNSSNEQHLRSNKKGFAFSIKQCFFLQWTTIYRLCESSVKYSQLLILQLLLVLPLTVKHYFAKAFLPFGACISDWMHQDSSCSSRSIYTVGWIYFNIFYVIITLAFFLNFNLIQRRHVIDFSFLTSVFIFASLSAAVQSFTAFTYICAAAVRDVWIMLDHWLSWFIQTQLLHRNITLQYCL